MTKHIIRTKEQLNFKKYIQSQKSIVKWCDTLNNYVNEVFCRRSYDAKMITKLLNDIEDLGRDKEHRFVVTVKKVKINKKN